MQGRFTLDEMYDCAERVALEARKDASRHGREKREIAEAMLKVIEKRRMKCRRTA